MPASKQSRPMPNPFHLDHRGHVIAGGGGWLDIATAPKDGEFLATDGVFLGVGSFYRRVEPAVLQDWKRWRRDREALGPLSRVSFEDRHEAVKRIPLHDIPNPKAGQVEEWYYAHAFYAFDGDTATHGYEGPVGFAPTLWMPMPTLTGFTLDLGPEQEACEEMAGFLESLDWGER